MQRKTIWLVALGLVVLASGGLYFGLKAYTERQVRLEIATALQKAPQIKAVRIAAVDVGPLRRSGEARQVQIDLQQAGTLTIDRVRLEGFAPGDPVPASLQFKAEGLHSSEAAKIWPTLGELGYATPMADLSCRYRYDAQSATLQIDELSVGLRDGGSLQLAGRIGGLDAARVKGALRQPDQWLMLLPGISIAELRLRYVDSSLTSRLLQQQARRQGTTAQVLASQIGDELDRQAGRSKDPRSRDFYATLRQFVQQPGTLSFSAAPQSPVTLLELMFTGGNAAEVVKRLNVQVARQ